MSFALGPDDPAFITTYTEMIEHERDRALAELKAMVAAHPDAAPAWAMLMRAHHRCLDSAASLEASRVLLTLDPGHSDGLHTAAFSLLALGDYEGALSAYRRAYRTTRSPLSGTTAALLLHRLGQLDGAAQAYDVILASTPPGSLDILHALRGAMNVSRDQGRPLEADRFAAMLLNAFRLNQGLVGSALNERDQMTGFHGWLELVQKANLAELLRSGLAADPSARVPPSFSLPDERDAFLTFAGGQAPGTLYIVKPARGSGGQGISVTDDPAAAADRSDVVVQRYIADPYLVDGRKGHLRIYALVTSVQPLRAYIYSEGIVRFAPEPYDPRPERLGEVAMHVTNTALHLGHPDLVISQDPNREDEGVIWSLTGLLRRMAADGLDPATVFDEIRALIAWFLRQAEREGLLARQAAHGPPRAFAAKLLGFDVLLDAQGHPWLIEMQSNPAARGAPLVQRINADLFANITRMTVGVMADDSLSAADLEALRTDPEALRRAELALERREQGGFRDLFT